MYLKEYLKEKKAIIDTALRSCFSETDALTADLVKAMKYSLFAGGKRLRPILCMAAASAVGGSESTVLPVACALELIHTYSLIHDDLPVMDDDDLRRGKPTSHKVFGEALALLAGDGLLTEAFRLMCSKELRQEVPAEVIIDVIELIATASGYLGMVGGQVADIQAEGKVVPRSVVDFIHSRKTGAMIRASVRAGAILGGGSKKQISALTSYGEKIGLAFQISDDILDLEGDSFVMGKEAGSDDKKGKATYPAVAGLKESKELQANLVDQAISSLTIFGKEAQPLREIAKYIIERKK